jgi:plasmid stabilization system protein ParE
VSNYILGPDADLDLDDIWEYIAADSIDAAERWIAQIFDGGDCSKNGASAWE